MVIRFTRNSCLGAWGGAGRCGKIGQNLEQKIKRFSKYRFRTVTQIEQNLEIKHFFEIPPQLLPTFRVSSLCGSFCCVCLRRFPCLFQMLVGYRAALTNVIEKGSILPGISSLHMCITMQWCSHRQSRQLLIGRWVLFKTDKMHNIYYKKAIVCVI